MDIGILIIATARAGSIDTIARTVEERGYESIWIPEHPVVPIGFKTPVPVAGGGGLPEHYGRWCDPFVALSIASAVTKRIKLATGICLCTCWTKLPGSSSPNLNGGWRRAN